MRRSLFLVALTAFAALLMTPALALAAEGDLFTRTLQTYGWYAALPVAFIGGIGTAATPCVYPMIAITVSVFGAKTASRGKAMLLSTSFVLGLSTWFVPFGLVAGLTGALQGALAGSWIVQVFEALLMFAMAFSMFGLYEISLPGSIQNRLAAIGGLGVKGAFLIGFALGPISAPCSTGILIGILDFIRHTQSASIGAGALFVYSVGMGLPFWIVGSFALGLPKPGRWMDYIKNFFGLVLIVMGLFYLRHLIPFLGAPPKFVPSAGWVSGGLMVIGLAIGAVHLSLKEGSAGERIRKVVGLALASLGAIWLVGYEPPRVNNGACAEIAWERDPTAAEAVARREGRPMLLDFGGTWCEQCEHLAHTTFRAPSVACAANEGRFVMLKIYDDDVRPANYEELYRHYEIHGLPTVILLDGHGHEVTRASGRYVAEDEMVTLLRRAEQRQSER